MRIPLLLSQKYGIDLSILHDTNIEQILKIDYPWINKLVRVHTLADLDDLNGIPKDIQDELMVIKDTVSNINYKSIVIAPLYYAKLRYYGSLIFKMFNNNELLARGGVYNIGDIKASGFALYTDECINQKMKKVGG